MTYATHHPSRTTASSTSLGEIVSTAFAVAMAHIAGRVREYRTRRALLQLNDSMLKDIGLSRSEIDAIVRETGRE